MTWAKCNDEWLRALGKLKLLMSTSESKDVWWYIGSASLALLDEFAHLVMRVICLNQHKMWTKERTSSVLPVPLGSQIKEREEIVEVVLPHIAQMLWRLANHQTKIAVASP